MIITPERLSYLIEVANTGSFSAAARSLQVSPSAVTQVIANFELDLDIRLFDRVAGQAPKLTTVGKAMYLQALEVLPRLQAMEKKAQSFQAGLEDKLNIAVYGFTLFPEYVDKIERLTKKFPELSINLLDVEDIADLELNSPNAPDIILAAMQLKERHGFDYKVIDQLEWSTVCSPCHSLAKIKAQLSHHDLLAQRQIMPIENSYAEKAVIESLRYSPNIINCARFYQLTQMLLAGTGFALYPTKLAAPLIAEGKLVKLNLDFEHEQTSWPIELAWTSALGPAGQWFIAQFIED